MPKLTKRVVEEIEPEAKERLFWDDELKGFGVRLSPLGRRSYLVQYRAGTRTRRVKLGVHGPVTAEQARKRAKEILGAVAGGADPAGAIEVRRKAPTVAELGERFLAEYAAHRCKPATQRDYRAQLRKQVFPRIGSYRVHEVKREHVQRLHEAMRATPYQANRTLAFLSKLFNTAEAWGLRPDGTNPCRHVQRYPEAKRERYLSAAELERLGATLAEVEHERSETDSAIAAFRLLLLTGCRLTEIQELRWQHVDEAAGVLRLPDSKTGAKTVWLNRAALDVLAGVERVPGNPFVIAGRRPRGHLTDLQRPWRRIRARAGLQDLRLHDLRHSFASVAVGGGVGLPVIGKLLGHSQVQTTARYAHLADDPVRAANEQVGEALAAALAPARRPAGAGS